MAPDFTITGTSAGGERRSLRTSSTPINMHRPSSPAPAPKRQRSKYFISDDSQHETSVADGRSPSVIRLTKRKPVAKSPMFMTTPSSIYAAACKCDSLLDALHGSSHSNDRRSNDGGSEGGSGESRSAEVEGSRMSDVEKALVIVHIHFGGCPTFERQFDSLLSNVDSPSPPAVERALHRSVRHLCDHECFRRAYSAIREFTFFWRDATIIEGGAGDATAAGSPVRRCRLTKGRLFSGWGCEVLPPAACGCRTPPRAKKRRGNVASPSAVVFVSPEGTEFNTRTRAVAHMNKSLPWLQQQSRTVTPPRQAAPLIPTTLLIDTTNEIDPQYSPFGLLEELFLRDPWKLLVSTICLNVTTRAQVDRTLHRYLQRWPDAETTARADWREISELISPLGLGTKRARGLIRFSKEWLALTEEHDAFALTEEQVKGLHFVGQYGWTAYEVFVLKRLPSGSVKVCDHALQLYVEYQLGRRAFESQKKMEFG